MSHISKKFTEALKEIKLQGGEDLTSTSIAPAGSIWKWVAILVFVSVVVLILVMLMRDTQPKNVVFERVPPRIPDKKRKREEENVDPNFTLLSDLLV